MNYAGWLVWGFAGTIVLTILMSFSQAFHMTRMNIPYILGMIVTPDRDRARLAGIFMHMANGWILSLLYIAAFHQWDGPAWWKGAVIGFTHASFLLVTMPIFPSLHPRMADETYGPTVVRQLEPPGFLALNYGIQTPVSIILSHIVFGIILGTFYKMP
ncbi:MAG: hypothetical protein WC732_01440 [Candidatus Omnitrophota bacterium]